MKQTIKHLFAIATIAILFSACVSDMFENDAATPTATTSEATSITSFSAVLNGSYDNKNRPKNISYGFLYIIDNENSSEEDIANRINNFPINGDGIIQEFPSNYGDGNNFSVQLRLAPNTKIYYCAYVNEGGFYSLGTIKSFTTAAMSDNLVVTDSAICINSRKLQLFGSINNELKNLDYMSYDFELSKNRNFKDIEYGGSDYSKEGTSFSATYENLWHNTVYYYRAYAEYWNRTDNEMVRIYGETKKITTNNTNIKATISIDKIEDAGLWKRNIYGNFSITGNDDDEYVYHNIGLAYSPTISTFTANNITSNDVYSGWIHSDTDYTFTAEMYNLSPDNTYYFAVYVEIDEQYFFSEVQTIKIPALKFTSLSSSKITAHSVVLSCVYDDSETECYDAGFVLSATSDKPTYENCENKGEVNFWEKIKLTEIKTSIIGLKANTTYYYRPYVNIYSTYYYGETQTFTTGDVVTIDGAVDLGLSVLWATDNLGATAENPIGNYYAWGETESKDSFSRNDYTLLNQTYIGGTQYDAATVKLGNGWRMPTVEEVSHLYFCCSRDSYSKKSVSGTLFTSQQTGYEIFIPNSGYIFESDTSYNYTYCFWCCLKEEGKAYSYYSNGINISETAPCHYGMPIRPVYDPLWDKK